MNMATMTSQDDEKSIEQKILNAGKTAPRITPDDIDAAIASEISFCLGDVIKDAPVSEGAKVLTICVLTLTNGFTVTGESACASPENFDAKIGRDIARKNAREKIWPLMGFALKQSLHAQANPGLGVSI